MAVEDVNDVGREIMKWLVKCLKHYADFNGRARRKEYWMFVLFNIIFSLVWMFLITFIYAFINSSDDSIQDERLAIAIMVANLSYGIALFLPGLAVFVRRLHDVGKSGWMLFVGLIPVIGGIWLFVLMVISGQQGENKYGPDPKISPEIFDEPAKLKSVGIVLIAVPLVWLLLVISRWGILTSFEAPVLGFFFPNVYGTINSVAMILLLSAGILLLGEEQLDEMREKGRVAIILLLLAFFIFFIFSALGTWNYFNLPKDRFNREIFLVNNFIHSLAYLSVALFIASVQFASQNVNLVRNAAVSVIVLSVLLLLGDVYLNMKMASIGSYSYQLLYIFGTFNILSPIACIVLASTFLSVKNQSTLDSPPVLESGDSSAV
jgi:uncharacterized membrane protein YhaH (DUF805 family)